MPPGFPQKIVRNPVAPAQAYVEYGLLVAVVMIGFLIGMNALMAGATTYLAHAEPTPNATVLAGLPNHVVRIDIRCTPLPQPNYTGVAINCSLTVTDITTIEPGTLPRGSMQFSSTPAGGTFSPSPCTLAGGGVTSGCTFTYTPTSTRQQDITAAYVPTSNHQSRSETLPGVALAVDKTQTQLACLDASVPVGEPSQCNVRVLDLYTNQFLSNAGVAVTAARGGGSFSPVGQLSPRGPSYNCVTDTNGVCGTLFRSGAASSADQGAYTINAAFDAVAQGDQDHDSSNATPGVVVSVGAPTIHPATITLSCDGGGGLGQTPGSPLQINLGASSRCMPTVTDTNSNDVHGNPTGIAPTGNVTNWSRTPDYGGTGNLSGTTCQLQGVTEATAQCQPPITYTPASVGAPPNPPHVGDHQITAGYSGDWTHQGGATAAPTDVYVKDQHLVQVLISPCTYGANRLFPLLIGAPASDTQCAVTVSDLASNPVTPTGSVSWEPRGTDGTGTFSPTTCTLQQGTHPVGTAECSGPVTYQPTSRGTPDNADQESTHTLAAVYAGDWLHPQLGDETGLTAVFVGNLHTVNVSVSCLPGDQRTAPLHVHLPETSTCTVRVVDPGPSPRTPTGQVGWGMTPVSSSGAGDFTPPTPCQLTSAGPDTASCQVTYKPIAKGAPDGGLPATVNTHNITATYSGDGLHPPPGGVGQTSTAPVYVDD